MTHSTVRGLALAIFVTLPALALAADKTPDLKGKWVGVSHSIVVGKGGHWPAGAGTFDNPGRAEKDLVIEIKGQDQRRFWGVTTLSGKGDKTTEPFIGALSSDNSGTFLIADTDGYLQGKFDGDKLSFCYAHTGAASTVVSCSDATRAR
ncbi:MULTISPECIES: hypothetical protein [Rhodopseudomonas]|uniref:Uncharacterized protein n=1 Tax=Rhodopseudomonas palustris TaxID=1076 RepID=A0A0D7EYF7_RHOPL|nr:MULTISPECIES: hypothetical protein [Rhodopseudomonas]KIZ45869.1 hypothetical protein OO17_07345 [Rhodopseudomonas palustris]MDF3814162.1 hypothetical protein [Rhodopseudomonas sp. BAL398]WOK16172.1 hypothetical protein RBJ75_18630 [Rhodopseudomonas sp. BAL398]